MAQSAQPERPERHSPCKVCHQSVCVPPNISKDPQSGIPVAGAEHARHHSLDHGPASPRFLWLASCSACSALQSIPGMSENVLSPCISCNPVLYDVKDSNTQGDMVWSGSLDRLDTVSPADRGRCLTPRTPSTHPEYPDAEDGMTVAARDSGRRHCLRACA